MYRCGTVHCPRWAWSHHHLMVVAKTVPGPDAFIESSVTAEITRVCSGSTEQQNAGGARMPNQSRASTDQTYSSWCKIHGKPVRSPSHHGNDFRVRRPFRLLRLKLTRTRSICGMAYISPIRLAGRILAEQVASPSSAKRCFKRRSPHAACLTRQRLSYNHAGALISPNSGDRMKCTSISTRYGDD